MLFSYRLTLLLRSYCLIYLDSILTIEILYDILSRSFPLNSLYPAVFVSSDLRNMPRDRSSHFDVYSLDNHVFSVS